ncbi:glycoside hydrolase family 3 N-terminal domain-containing protein [uncultured Corynebacterium sp.]|uniref:glycoside hydrolase family 3 N-terminal domain-containing protein n=1 Tax=uncultured Corynebacterium sp. TaxID=159447 RepID=UPI0025DF745A|nr:glycoside hydrolase family 3 N-terminal domain-containing protein [uncultured Corynebacterium sp.]
MPRRHVAAGALGFVLVIASSACSLSTPTDQPADTSTSSATSAAPGSESSGAAESSAPPAEDRQACARVEGKAPREMAGRMLAVGVTTYESAEQAVDEGVRHLFIGSQTDKSILNGQGDPARSLAALEERAGEPLTVSVDEEGGLVQRLSEIVGELPSAQQMAETMSPEQVRDLMAEHGKKVRDLGITVDFAPVVDLAGGQEVSDNAIGSRSFSADPKVAADYARAYSEGLQQAGVTPVLKHFPGHGHATGDSHMGAVTTPPLEQMQGNDLLPFRELVDVEGMAVMVGHVEVPGLGEALPSSVNPAAYKLLREGGYGPKHDAPGFDGVIYTDDLTGMKAVTDRYPGPEAAVAALEAGADVALAAAGAVEIPDVVEAIRVAIDDGRIPEDRVRDSVNRTCVTE